MEINLSIVERVCFKLAQMLTQEEPIPEFASRFDGKLESCIATPFQQYYKKDLYPGLLKKASVLFYLMIKNHPFKNGNKRIAVTTLLVYLMLNEKWLEADAYSLYKFAVWVAESDPTVKDSVILAIEDYLGKNLITFRHEKGHSLTRHSD